MYTAPSLTHAHSDPCTVLNLPPDPRLRDPLPFLDAAKLEFAVREILLGAPELDVEAGVVRLETERGGLNAF